MQPKSDPMVGILIRTRIGMDVYGTNTRIEQMPLGDLQAGRRTGSGFPPGVLADAAAVHADRGHAETPTDRSHDWLDDAIAFDVVDTRVAAGVANLEGEGGMARLTVKVHPRAKRTGVAGRFGDAWKLDLAAPPVDGKANDECVRFFAELAGVPRSRVRIVTGLTSRTQGCGD